MNMMLHKVLLFVSMGLMLSAISETLFYPVEIGGSYYMYVLLYGLYGYAMIFLNYYYKISSFAALFISASIFGFLIEGAFVGILYESLPFSIVWTSLAWHVLITVLFFWYYFRKVLLTATLKIKTLYSIFLGLILGLWGGYSWSAEESELTGEVSYNWIVSPTEYAIQIMFGFAVFLLGHYIYERTVNSMHSTTKKELRLIAGLIFISFIIGNGILYFPFSLILVALVGGCLYLLKNSNKTSEKIFTSYIDKNHIHFSGYLISLLIPITTIALYYIFYTYQIGLEMNALYFTVGGIISVYMFFQSMIQLMKS